jgi:hypothetical protein
LNSRFDLELALQAVDDDLEVQLAHAGDDGLPRLFVGVGTERRVLVSELLQARAELVDVTLGARLDRDGDDRIGKHHLFQDDGLLFVAERIPGASVAKADRRVDVARVALLQLLALVRVHAQDTAEPLAFAARGVVNR